MAREFNSKRIQGDYASRGVTVSVVCMEALGKCVEVLSCVTDSDCNDGLFCNGNETCDNGVCSAPSNVDMCPGPNQTCSETHQACFDSQGSTSEGTNIALIVVFSVLAGLLLILLIGVSIYVANSSSSSSGATATMQARLDGTYGAKTVTDISQKTSKKYGLGKNKPQSGYKRKVL